MADVEENSSLNINSNVGASASVCYGRNMTFPRQASSYSHRRELPAVVTEGENYRLSGEVRNTLMHSPFRSYFLDFHKPPLISYCDYQIRSENRYKLGSCLQILTIFGLDEFEFKWCSNLALFESNDSKCERFLLWQLLNLDSLIFSLT